MYGPELEDVCEHQFVNVLTVIFSLYCVILHCAWMVIKRVYCLVDCVDGYRKYGSVRSGLFEQFGLT